MNYEEFRAAWDEALLRSGLLSHTDRPEEAVLLGAMDRRYSVLVGRFFGGQPSDPFLGSLELSWEWDALLSARMRTIEEDVVDELFGRRDASRIHTEVPWLRVDIALSGTLPLEHPMPLPAEKVWGAWVAEVAKRVHLSLPEKLSLLSEGGGIDSWRGEPEARVTCGPAGDLWLTGVKLQGWQAIVLPRQWDHPEREPDESPQRQLEAFAKVLHKALQAWKASLRRLLSPAGKSSRRLH